MLFTKYSNTFRWIMIAVSFIIVLLILWNTYVFFQNFKEEERVKMKNWSFASKELSTTDNLDANIGNLPIEVLQSNKTTPMIIVHKDGSYDTRNIKENVANDSIKVQKLIAKFKNEYNPIKVTYDGKLLQTIYYGNSPLLNKLKYYPLALLLIIFLFAGVIFFFYKSTKNASQNKLWSGMAKETAHQIGTPLSSLIGWTELLKTENVNPDYIIEIEKDIDRLQTITERFSKIGSLPTLETADIIFETKQAYDYLKRRSSDLVAFEMIAPYDEIPVKINKQLYSWTIENLVKNGIDAMKGRGKITIEITPLENDVKIKISDTGKGIPKKNFNTIFEPGYTTKKRGWGLGLSLTKRIVEDFHKGRIRVLQSTIGKGTTFQISLKRYN
ncbi:Histidine kinase-, DNA gyrase B-, and HSP90-like ATPase [Hyunsoonleella jejuensis]|uniref:histidine kinase n=1 Tax=Hyunsoonleella jejuensis TaxID=419940 RepID=A0A1H9BVT3_9FLAO|nr:HAMP domain-containing sensor histidine kinase [Hyunsoonleella jejuensis]SEP93086.1 Histidine kinase-, DNA gyrase B-, and HSP90-like ATPase [Hyunsoonleella jejuensis]